MVTEFNKCVDTFLKELNNIRVDTIGEVCGESIKLLSDGFNLFGNHVLSPQSVPNFLDCTAKFVSVLLTFAKHCEKERFVPYLREAFAVIFFVTRKLKVNEVIIIKFVIKILYDSAKVYKDVHIRELLYLFLALILSVTENVIDDIQSNDGNIGTLLNKKLTQILENTSDIETQAVLVEIFLKLIKTTSSNSKINNLFQSFFNTTSESTSYSFSQIRMLLDQINNNSSNIFSIKCNSLFFTSTQMYKIETSDYKWMDFDMVNSKLTFFCESSILKKKELYKPWKKHEAVTVYIYDIIKTTFAYNSINGLEIMFTFKSNSVTTLSNTKSRKNWKLNIVCSKATERFFQLRTIIIPKLFPNFLKKELHISEDEESVIQSKISAKPKKCYRDRHTSGQIKSSAIRIAITTEGRSTAGGYSTNITPISYKPEKKISTLSKNTNSTEISKSSYFDLLNSSVVKSLPNESIQSNPKVSQWLETISQENIDNDLELRDCSIDKSYEMLPITDFNMVHGVDEAVLEISDEQTDHPSYAAITSFTEENDTNYSSEKSCLVTKSKGKSQRLVKNRKRILKSASDTDSIADDPEMEEFAIILGNVTKLKPKNISLNKLLGLTAITERTEKSPSLGKRESIGISEKALVDFDECEENIPAEKQSSPETLLHELFDSGQQLVSSPIDKQPMDVNESQGINDKENILFASPSDDGDYNIFSSTLRATKHRKELTAMEITCVENDLQLGIPSQTKCIEDILEQKNEAKVATKEQNNIQVEEDALNKYEGLNETYNKVVASKSAKSITNEINSQSSNEKASMDEEVASKSAKSITKEINSRYSNETDSSNEDQPLSKLQSIIRVQKRQESQSKVNLIEVVSFKHQPDSKTVYDQIVPSNVNKTNSTESEYCQLSEQLETVAQIHRENEKHYNITSTCSLPSNCSLNAFDKLISSKDFTKVKKVAKTQDDQDQFVSILSSDDSGIIPNSKKRKLFDPFLSTTTHIDNDLSNDKLDNVSVEKKIASGKEQKAQTRRKKKQKLCSENELWFPNTTKSVINKECSDRNATTKGCRKCDIKKRLRDVDKLRSFLKIEFDKETHMH